MHLRCSFASVGLPIHGLSLSRLRVTQRSFATALDLLEVPNASEPSETTESSEPLEVLDNNIENPFQRSRGDIGSHLPKHIIPKDADIPAYPYGHRQLFKQANTGLYGEQTIQFGNNVSRDTETKTRRHWKPNILSKSLYSIALKKKIKLRVAARVLKTIDREGGLDEYLLKDSERRIKELGPLGWALRWTLMQKPVVIDRLRSEAAALGLSQEVIDEQWPTRRMMAGQNAPQTISDNIRQERYEMKEDQGSEEFREDSFENHAVSSKRLKNERKVAKAATKEYKSALLAAQRYLRRGLVNSEQDGLKVAFVRAKERREAAIRQEENYHQNIQRQFDVSSLQKLKAELKQPNMNDELARKIMYSREKQEGIKKAGGYKAWRENVEAERATSRTPVIDRSDRHSKWQADKKDMYAKQVEGAENASDNNALDAETRAYLVKAISKASKAIEAISSGGAKAYAELIVRDTRKKHEPTKSLEYINTSHARSEPQTEVAGDAWGAIINSTNKYRQDQLDS